MRLIETELPGVRIVEPRVHADARGFFLESYHALRLAEAGIAGTFVQDNHSASVQGTLRGLHYQLRRPQAKLCRVIVGEVYDVAVDIRRASPYFGKWVGVVLSAENKRQLYIPPGFAHGFLVLSERAEFLYKCDDFYTPGDEFGVAWNDPALGIDWPLYGPPLLSEKDQRLQCLGSIDPERLPVLNEPQTLAV